MEIKLYKNGSELGFVTFNGTEETGGAYSPEMAVATIESDINLEIEINRWFQENTGVLPVFGGTYIKDLGRHGDGVLAVLHTLGERRGFTFDRALIPVPIFPAGSVG